MGLLGGLMRKVHFVSAPAADASQVHRYGTADVPCLITFKMRLNPYLR